MSVFKHFHVLGITGQNLALMVAMAAFEKRKRDRDCFKKAY